MIRSILDKIEITARYVIEPTTDTNANICMKDINVRFTCRPENSREISVTNSIAFPRQIIIENVFMQDRKFPVHAIREEFKQRLHSLVGGDHYRLENFEINQLNSRFRRFSNPQGFDMGYGDLMILNWYNLDDAYDVDVGRGTRPYINKAEIPGEYLFNIHYTEEDSPRDMSFALCDISIPDNEKLLDDVLKNLPETLRVKVMLEI